MTDDPRPFTPQWDRPEIIRRHPTTFMGGFRKAIGDGANRIVADVLEKLAERIDEHSAEDLMTIATEMATLQEAAAIVRKHRHLMSQSKGQQA